MTTNLPKYGKPIQFSNSTQTLQETTGATHGSTLGGNGMVSQFLNVKNNYRTDIERIAGSDIHAYRYFCYDDCAFIFDVHVLKALLNAIDEGKMLNDAESPGCVVLFQGLRKSPLDENDIKKGCAFGRPTLIAAPYVRDAQGNLHHVQVTKPYNPIEIFGGDPPFDAFEHPGDGNSGLSLKTATSRESISEFLPKVVEKNAEDADTDYSIKRTIALEDYQQWQ